MNIYTFQDGTLTLHWGSLVFIIIGYFIIPLYVGGIRRILQSDENTPSGRTRSTRPSNN